MMKKLCMRGRIFNYIGELKNQKKHGYGTLIFKNGEKYTGEWKDDSFSGRGSFYSNNFQYIGEWQNFQKIGFGSCSWSNGARYIGCWKNDMENGNGKYIWPSGAIYEGEHIDGKAHGKGTFWKPNGKKYSGCWNEGNPDFRTISFYEWKKITNEFLVLGRHDHKLISCTGQGVTAMTSTMEVSSQSNDEWNDGPLSDDWDGGNWERHMG
tara:strand:- start:419 stop:1045 length:627 start_codon:yes stop_codon:yes gene_type:complete